MSKSKITIADVIEPEQLIKIEAGSNYALMLKHTAPKEYLRQMQTSFRELTGANLIIIIGVD